MWGAAGNVSDQLGTLLHITVAGFRPPRSFVPPLAGRLSLSHNAGPVLLSEASLGNLTLIRDMLGNELPAPRPRFPLMRRSDTPATCSVRGDAVTRVLRGPRQAWSAAAAPGGVRVCVRERGAVAGQISSPRPLSPVIPGAVSQGMRSCQARGHAGWEHEVL